MNDEALPMIESEDQTLPLPGPSSVKVHKVALRPEDFVMPDGKAMDPEELGIELDYTPEVDSNSFAIDEDGDFNSLMENARAVAESVEDAEVEKVEAIFDRKFAERESAAQPTVPLATSTDWLAIQKEKWSAFTAVNPFEEPLKWLNMMRSNWVWVLAGAWVLMFLLNREFTLWLTFGVLVLILAGIVSLAHGAKVKAHAKEKAHELQEARARKKDTPLPSLTEEAKDK